ncbi:MAG: DUF4352 domain-containing protein [Acidimicrobiales bacterium]
MWKLARVGAVVAVAVLFACSDADPQSSSRSTSPPQQPAMTTPTTGMQLSEPTPTTGMHLSEPTLQKLGQPFVLDDLRMTMLSVQDPFPPTPAVQPARGNRLVSIRSEVVSQSSATRNLSDLPAVELRDSTGASYQSEHGRLSVVGGSRTFGELPAGTRMETSAVFEVPESATDLRVAFRSLLSPGHEEAVVILN